MGGETCYAPLLDLLALAPARATITAVRERKSVVGGGGECGLVAIAINDVLFAGRGRLVATLSDHVLSYGRWFGHVVVEQHGMYWDLFGSHPNIERLAANYSLPVPHGIVHWFRSAVFGSHLVIEGHRRDRIPVPTKRQALKTTLFEVTATQIHQHMPGAQGIQKVRDAFTRARTRGGW